MIFLIGCCIMVSMIRERMFTVKKLFLIGVLLLTLAVALAACDGDTPSETDTKDTEVTEKTASEDTAETPDTPATETEVPAEPVDSAPDEPGTESPSEEATEADTVPAETASPTDTPTDPETETDPDPETEPDTAPDPETEPEPEFSGPGKLIHVSNDELRFMNNMGKEIGCAYDPGGYAGWKSRTITMGVDQVAVFMDWGWAAFDSQTYQFGYIVNGASFFSDSYAREAEAAVVEYAAKLGAKNCARYCGGLTAEALRLGKNSVQFCVILDGGVLCYLREYTVNLTKEPVRLDGSYWNVPIDSWTVSGHNPHIQDTSNGMVAAGGVEKGALLHQGAIGVGTVDLSKYSKVIIMWGCDNSQITVDHYNKNAHNRIMLTKVDTDGMMSPESKDIIAYADYTLGGWRVRAIEIDLSKVTYKGPVYITIDALPGTFALFSSIEFLVE